MPEKPNPFLTHPKGGRILDLPVIPASSLKGLIEKISGFSGILDLECPVLHPIDQEFRQKEEQIRQGRRETLDQIIKELEARVSPWKAQEMARLVEAAFEAENADDELRVKTLELVWLLAQRLPWALPRPVQQKLLDFVAGAIPRVRRPREFLLFCNRVIQLYGLYYCEYRPDPQNDDRLTNDELQEGLINPIFAAAEDPNQSGDRLEPLLTPMIGSFAYMPHHHFDRLRRIADQLAKYPKPGYSHDFAYHLKGTIDMVS